MSKFTPGPWYAKEWRCHAATTIMSGDTVIAECSGNGRLSTESIADANLIAAAPEMYEALKAWQDHLAESLNCMDAKEQSIYFRGKAALAKADTGAQ